MSSHGWAVGEGKGGVRVYEAYEVKKKEKNYTVFDFTAFIFIFFCYEVFAKQKNKKALLYYDCRMARW